MKRLNQVLVLASVAFAFCLSEGKVAAQERQGRGGFNPEEFRQRMTERMREQFDVKNDDEWKVIEERIEKVMEARREVGFGSGMGMMFGRRPGGDRSSNDQGERRGSRGFGGEPSPEAEDLQKAIEAKAPADEIKAKLAKYREARKEKEAKVDKAREELRKVLSVRQEATAVLLGLLE